MRERERANEGSEAHWATHTNGKKKTKKNPLLLLEMYYVRVEIIGTERGGGEK